MDHTSPTSAVYICQRDEKYSLGFVLHPIFFSREHVMARVIHDSVENGRED